MEENACEREVRLRADAVPPKGTEMDDAAGVTVVIAVGIRMGGRGVGLIVLQAEQMMVMVMRQDGSRQHNHADGCQQPCDDGPMPHLHLRFDSYQGITK